MTPARLLIGLLLVATVLVDLVAWSALMSCEPLGQSGNGLVVQAFWLLGICQAGLLACWTGWAPFATFPWRLLVTVVFLCVWGYAIKQSVTSFAFGAIPHTRIVAVIGWKLATPAIAVLGFFLVARTTGLRLQPLPNPGVLEGHLADPRRMQFSLGCLLSWLTVSAILLGLFQHVEGRSLLTAPLHDQHLGRIATIGLCHAGLVAIAAMTALGHGGKRYFLLGLVVMAVVAVHAQLIVHVGIGANVLVCLLELGWLLGVLWVFRVVGYRFVAAGE